MTRLGVLVSGRGSNLDAILRLVSGELDALVSVDGRPWDHAPAVIIVEEAGGRFSDRHGGRRIDLEEVRYSNGALHAAFEQLLDSTPR